MPFCSSCGAAIEGGKFCSTCGASTGLKPAAQATVAQAPIRKRPHGCLIAIAVVVGLFILFAIIGSLGDHSKSSSPASHGIDTSAAAQAGREAWIESAKAQGVFLRIGDSSPTAYVGPAWSAMTFDQKQAAAGVVAAHFYLKSSENTILLLYGGYTGKKIGVYSLEMGLQLD